MSLGYMDLCIRGEERASGGPEVGQGEWMSLGYMDLCIRGGERASGGPEVGQGEWMSGINKVSIFCSKGLTKCVLSNR